MLLQKGKVVQFRELLSKINMENKDLRIGNLVKHKDLGEVVVGKIFQDFIYGYDGSSKSLGMIPLNELEPIDISEKYLLDFGFTKVVEKFQGFEDIFYELQTKEAFFVYSEDWSLAIADSKKTFTQTGNYLTPNLNTTNKVHLWQNLFKSLTGDEDYNYF